MRGRSKRIPKRDTRVYLVEDATDLTDLIRHAEATGGLRKKQVVFRGRTRTLLSGGVITWSDGGSMCRVRTEPSLRPYFLDDNGRMTFAGPICFAGSQVHHNMDAGLVFWPSRFEPDGTLVLSPSAHPPRAGDRFWIEQLPTVVGSFEQTAARLTFVRLRFEPS